MNLQKLIDDEVEGNVYLVEEIHAETFTSYWPNFDWRHHVPEEVQKYWKALSDYERCLHFIKYQKLANSQTTRKGERYERKKNKKIRKNDEVDLLTISQMKEENLVTYLAETLVCKIEMKDVLVPVWNDSSDCWTSLVSASERKEWPSYAPHYRAYLFLKYKKQHDRETGFRVFLSQLTDKFLWLMREDIVDENMLISMKVKELIDLYEKVKP